MAAFHNEPFKGHSGVHACLKSWGQCFIGRENGSVADATWEPAKELMKKFPQFCLKLEDKRDGLIYAKVGYRWLACKNRITLPQIPSTTDSGGWVGADGGSSLIGSDDGVG
ncbi:hypothetical protein Tco_0753657 [Tanacetum coccineum]